MGNSRDNNLARIIFDQSQETQQTLQRPTGSRFQNILNLVASVANQTANPNTNMGQILGGFGRGMGQGTLMRNQNDFQSEIAQIHQSPADPQQKLQAIMSTISKYGQNPADFKDILDVYTKQITESAMTPRYDTQGNQVGMFPKGSTFQPASQDDSSPYAKRQQLLASTKIREEFLNRPEIKDYISINTQVRSMDRIMKEIESGNMRNKVAADQALVTMFNKLSDPSSVVRESEYARTPSNLPIWNAFQGALQKIDQGGAGLTDQDRKALVWGAKVIANERGRTFNDTLQGYNDLAEQYGIDPKLISRGLTPHTEYSFDGGAGAKPIYATNPKTKIRIMSLDGGKTWQTANQ